MYIKEIINSGHSKSIAQSIANYVVLHPDAISELMECFFSDNYRTCQRAAWPVGIIGKTHPEILAPFFGQMIRALDNPRHDAVIRNTVRTFQDIELPEELSGELYDRCFQYLVDPKYPVAIKVFSMTVLVNISNKFEGLKEELAIAIEDQIPIGTAGYISRAKRELKRLRKK